MITFELLSGASALHKTALDGHSGAIASTGPVTAKSAALEFEAILLQNWLEVMMPREMQSISGQGTGAKYWNSMLAEQIAFELARSGAIGIAPTIASNLVGR